MMRHRANEKMKAYRAAAKAARKAGDKETERAIWREAARYADLIGEVYGILV